MHLLRSTWGARLVAGLLLCSLLPVLGWPVPEAAAAHAQEAEEQKDAAQAPQAPQALDATPAPAHRLLRSATFLGAPTLLGAAQAVHSASGADAFAARSLVLAEGAAGADVFVPARRLLTSSEPMGP